MRSRGWPYVAVDETKRAIFSGCRVKSFDFLLYRPDGPHWLVDVKGRKFPYDGNGGLRRWENWVTRDDLQSLAEWERVFGGGFESVLVFAYWLTQPEDEHPFDLHHTYSGACYSFRFVRLAEYRARCVSRSSAWQTVTVPTATFRELQGCL
ncbi:MAG: hypothetical protein HJJLKODD_01520 [Phycisphaerae bacterium]|nr:hypothetical protein [Phycisphaerae bacterium]